MNTPTLRHLLAGACALALLTAASAEPREAKEPKGPSKADLAKYDANKDGRLDEAETARLQAAKDAARQERLAKYDANKDGKINKDEKVAEDADKAAAREARKAAAEEKKAAAEAKKAERAREKARSDKQS